jgi:hypothetical protein
LQEVFDGHDAAAECRDADSYSIELAIQDVGAMSARVHERIVN